MEDVFKPTSLTIKQLFGNTDALYQVPRYQRPYKWGDDQLEKLWDDLQDAKGNEPYYFLGSIITAKPHEESSYMDIVDGQQRTTTLLILFCVLRDHYPNLNANVLDSDPYAVDGNIIESSIRFNGRFERLRLKTHSNHESDFQKLVLNPDATKTAWRPSKVDLRKEEEPKFKFLNTAKFFIDRLSELEDERVGEFVNYLFNQVKIIRIDCQSVTFAIKLFQVLNDRGLDLSNSDLIKSYLIAKIHRHCGSDEELKRQKENQFIDDWKTCEAVATDTGDSVNDLFVLYEYYRLGENPKRGLYEELTKLFDKEDANEIIADFKEFVTSYKKEIYDKKDALLYGFWYLRWSTFWRSILLTALHTSYPDFRKLAFLLRRYYYLNWIAGHTITRIKQTSFNLIKWIKAGKAIEEIEAELHKSLIENYTISSVKWRLNRPIYFESWCKPLLYLIEYEQQDSPKFLYSDDSNIHVEHIIPRAFDRNPEWASVENPEQLEEKIDTPGNLTLLSGRKNIAARNSGFTKKIQAYTGTGLHSASDEKVTSFRITQRIVDDYNAGKFGRQWNLDAVSRRESWFIAEVEKILDVELSNT
jgi:uncharacterized protein with ParB-like and HNH nuclease domain